ncbi:endoplasmic reticulum retention protein [Serendipita sp. 411]|nr:endoplasmic reticulum retention protein [Serendipita sp. 400]KAG8842200.1 endoplasmic reticulum retention protein [Serendipita sp. 411]
MECRARTGGRTVLSRAKISKVLPEMLKYMVLAFLIAYRINYTSFSWVPGKTWTPQNLPGSPLAILLSYFSVKDLINMDKRQAYEVLWSTSIFLAAIADIPQYITYYRHVRTKVDGWLMSSLELAAMSRIFYMIHWISVYGHLHISDPISFVGGLIQVLVFWRFYVLVLGKVSCAVYNNNRDIEAQREYGTRRG